LAGAGSVNSAIRVVVGSTAHVVATYDGTTISIYVNGLIDNSTSGTGPITNYDASDFGLGIGNTYGGGNGGFVGVIDEVAIYNYALSATRILAHYQAGSN
jgi:hypothetical protein